MTQFCELSYYTCGWAIGIIEGEGCFSKSGKYATVKIEMTDKDVIVRLNDIMRWPNRIYERTRGENKTSYEIKISGKKAVRFMEDVKPFMGERRKARIEEILNGQ